MDRPVTFASRSLSRRPASETSISVNERRPARSIMTTRCTFAHVDLAALQSNFRAIAEFLAEQTRLEGSGRHVPGIIAVVKANAYGHGAAAVGRALQDAGAKILACADIEEAIVLRKAGVTAEILIFGALGV